MRLIMWMSVGLVPFLAGCIFIGGGRRIEIEEKERVCVEFASIPAAEAFYSGMSLSNRSDYTDKHGFVVLFLAIDKDKVFHETHHFNAQVRMADVNGDGTVSEEEATSYLERMRNAEEEEEGDD